MTKWEEKPHKKLTVWQASIDFVAELYEKIKSFPAEEKFGLVSQMQRSATSIPANIAEGAARKNTKEYLQFLYIARGSLSELDTYLEICLKLHYFTQEEYLEQLVSLRPLPALWKEPTYKGLKQDSAEELMC